MDSNNNTEQEVIQEEIPQEEQPKKTGLFSKKPKEKKTAVREVFDWVEIIALSLAFVLLTFSYVARQARVEGPSMQETFHEGEPIVISNLFYTPKQGDIVVFQVPEPAPSPTREPIIKRVIAVGGQSVFINFDTWTVYVYEDPDKMLKTESEIIAAGIEPLDEPYIEAMRMYHLNERMKDSGIYPVQVEEGKIFCMGDNRNNSSDSRSAGLGQVDVRYVLGRVLFRINPLTFKF